MRQQHAAALEMEQEIFGAARDALDAAALDAARRDPAAAASADRRG